MLIKKLHDVINRLPFGILNVVIGSSIKSPKPDDKYFLKKSSTKTETNCF